VTYCPLCNTALAFDRTVDGKVLDFGTTGRLRYSDLVMYDRQTESWWQQATGDALVGTYAGRRLGFIPAPVMSWRDFRTTYPEGRVLSRNTGFTRPYGRNPYAGYDTRSGPIAGFFPGALDARLPALERVVAVDRGDSSIAYAFSLLSRTRVVNDDVSGVPIVVFWVAGTASALDAAEIARGRDVGATGVFDRRLDGRALSFEALPDSRFRDRETGRVWDLSGHGASGSLAGRRLTPLAHGNHFWFASAAFRPEARLVR
jgi:Protein of unknown function (DUF3179)